jgi:hypothetical protein
MTMLSLPSLSLRPGLVDCQPADAGPMKCRGGLDSCLGITEQGGCCHISDVRHREIG